MLAHNVLVDIINLQHYDNPKQKANAVSLLWACSTPVIGGARMINQSSFHSEFSPTQHDH